MPGLLGKWKHYEKYGVEESYQKGMDWLEPCSMVEDWGCGPAYAKNFRTGSYRGIDGTDGFCDVVADLTHYTSFTPGLFMRHVLEHNEEWEKVLTNALKSFTERMALIFFLPWGKETRVLKYQGEIPDIQFNKDDVLKFIKPYVKDEIVIQRKDKPLYDTLFRLQK
jgi:hypothetical protein